ncbi:MAG: GNAT family N-acetyltransferase [Pseudomonadota bacterium]
MNQAHPDRYKVTPASYEDIARLAFLEKQVYAGDAYSALFFYQALRQWPKTFLTVKDADSAEGYSLLVPISPSKLSLMSLLIGESAQGKGLGKKLLQESVTLARSLGYKEIELSVSPANTPAIALYQSFGFKKTETIADYLGPGEDRTIMTLLL